MPKDKTMKSMMLAIAMAATAATALAQAPASPAAAPVQVREPPSNLQLGVHVERFIGDPARTVARMSREAIMTRPVFLPGDPSGPGAPGAVLRYRKEVVIGTMEPGEATPVSTMPEQQLIYVKGGSGRLDDGSQAWDLKPGIAVLIPPNQAHRLTNTGEGTLEMIMLSALPRAGVTAINGILVRDTAKILYVEQGAHWNNFSKAPFRDVGERLLLVYLAPMSIAGPHSHTHETEELWVKITDGPALMQVGSEIRHWEENVGLFAPNNYQTVHAAINIGTERQAWFYIQGQGPDSPPPAAAPLPAGAEIRPGNNPIIAQSMAAATVPGRPLNPPAARR
jgi:mannose-6-phosphate isomerase-like protein (cupin superfamily)